MLRSTNNRRLSFGIENLENRRMMAADVMASLPVDAGDAAPDTYFVADSFSFGVEREMKESGEKGGTADINIGVGELQECTISKSMDSVSPKLAQAAINGDTPERMEAETPGTNEVDVVFGDSGEAQEAKEKEDKRATDLADLFCPY